MINWDKHENYPVLDHRSLATPLLQEVRKSASASSLASIFTRAFTDSIDAARLRVHFAHLASIRVYEDGSIRNSLNRVNIGQELPQRPFSFERASLSLLLGINYF